MSLLELLTGSVVFTLAATSSLHLLGLAAAATLAQARQEQRRDEAETSLLRAEAALRRLATQGGAASTGPCNVATDRLMRDLAALPLAPGLARRLERSVGGDGVVLSLAVEGEAEPRQRLLLPAALGACRASAAGPVPPQGGVGEAT